MSITWFFSASIYKEHAIIENMIESKANEKEKLIVNCWSITFFFFKCHNHAILQLEIDKENFINKNCN